MKYKTNIDYLIGDLNNNGNNGHKKTFRKKYVFKKNHKKKYTKRNIKGGKKNPISDDDSNININLKKKNAKAT